MQPSRIQTDTNKTTTKNTSSYRVEVYVFPYFLWRAWSRLSVVKLTTHMYIYWFPFDGFWLFAASATDSG